VARNLSTGEVTVQPGLLWLAQPGGGKSAAAQVQQCPSFEGSSTTVADPYTGYNYNTSRVGRGYGESLPSPARVGEIPHPARCALFGDGQWQAGANKFMRSPFPTPADAGVQSRSAGTQGYRHRGKTNVIFCDGHAETWAMRFTNTSDATRPAEGTGFLSPDNSLYTGE
jgi:prepilin-type processing-associated H-X9-DG protein